MPDMDSSDPYTQILIVALTAIGTMTGLFLLVRWRRRRLMQPLADQSCPECGNRFEPAKIKHIDGLEYLVDLPKEESFVLAASVSKRVGFSCPCCHTRWKLHGHELEPTAQTVSGCSYQEYFPREYFLRMEILFVQKYFYGLVWQTHRNIKNFLQAMVAQREPFLPMAYAASVLFWLLVLPGFGGQTFGKQVDVAFVVMILGIIFSTVAYWRCHDRRLARMAVVFNVLPIVIGFLLLGGVLLVAKWNLQTDGMPFYGQCY